MGFIETPWSHGMQDSLAYCGFVILSVLDNIDSVHQTKYELSIQHEFDTDYIPWNMHTVY